MQEEELEIELNEYRNQISAVEAALQLETGNSELVELKSNLQEVIKLTEENLLNVKKEKLLATLNQLERENFPKVEEIKKESNVPVVVAEENDQLSAYLEQLEGLKCRAPHRTQWGELTYHNAIVMAIKPSDIETAEEIQVSVLFCNPTCQSMKPCNFFLEGHCKFDTDNCRFSHGCLVKLVQLQEFVEPNYSLLQRDSICLAKYMDGIWYKAVVEEVLDEHKFKVKYSTYDTISTLELEDILPLEIDDVSESSDSDDDDLEDELKVVPIDTSEFQMGEWEKFTKGIGSKLLSQMGYIKGQGLGKNSQGRTEPVPVVVLPKGKSLDKCMQIREKQNSKCRALSGPSSVSSGGAAKKSVFDFLNSRLALRKKEDVTPLVKIKKVKESTSKGLNIQLMNVEEQLKKASKEMVKLKQSLARNQNKDRVMTSHVEKRISEHEKFVASLQNQQKMLSQEQNSRQLTKKIQVF